MALMMAAFLTNVFSRYRDFLFVFAVVMSMVKIRMKRIMVMEDVTIFALQVLDMEPLLPVVGQPCVACLKNTIQQCSL